MARGRGLIPAVLLVIGMVGFAVPWRTAGSGGDDAAGSDSTKRCVLPPGHPEVDCAPEPGRAGDALPPGHPPVQGRRPLPPGHPPIDALPSTPPGVITPTPLGGAGGSAPPIFML
jgi:hypothetical protein